MQISSIRQSFAPNDQFENLFCELYLKYKQPLYKYILSIVDINGVAEDIIQDVFAKLWAGNEKYTSVVEDYSAFLFRMAHNEAISHLRREKQRQQVFKNVGTQRIDALNLTEEIIYQKELEVLLQQAIGNLSPQCKKVYLLGKMEGVPLDKLADIFQVSYQTVKNQMRSANQEIRNYINERIGTECKRKLNKGKVKKHGLESMKTLKAA